MDLQSWRTFSMINGSETRPESAEPRWNERVQKDGLSSMIVAFGHGDGGGGPTATTEYLRRAKNWKVRPGRACPHPLNSSKDAEKKGIPSVRYVGELLISGHEERILTGAHEEILRAKRIRSTRSGILERCSREHGKIPISAP